MARSRARDLQRTANTAQVVGTKPELPSTAVEVLEKFKVQYEFMLVETSEIGKVSASQHQVRSKFTEESQVEDYATAMRNGALFPAIVLAKNGQRFERIDCNHRLAALELIGEPLVWAAVFTSTPIVKHALRVQLNLGHGLFLTRTDRAMHAIYSIENDGLTVAAAAENAGLSAQYVRDELNKYRARKRMDEVGLSPKEVNSLNITQQLKLATLRSDPVIRDAAKLVLDADLTADQCTVLVHNLNELRSDAAKQTAIEDARRTTYADHISSKAVTGGSSRPKARNSAAVKLNCGIGLILSVTADDVILTAADCTGLAGRCDTAIQSLLDMAAALRK
jgi:ParB-like chromosome segregation protein Spo0J